MAKYCKKCGTQLEEGSMFCPECGTTIVTAAAAEQTGPAEPVQAIAPPQVAPPPQQVQPAAPPQVQPVPPPMQGGFAPPPPAPPQQAQFTPQPPPPQGGYAPAGQPGYPPAGVPVPSAPKKPSKALKIIIIIAAVVAALIIVGIVVAGGATKAVANKDFFDIGPDQVPSVMNVLGEFRKVSGFSSSISGGVETMVVTYDVTENQGDDMFKYSQALMNNYGFYNTNPFDFTGPSGSGFQFAKASVEEGYIIMLTIAYDETGYTITIERSEGTLTIYDNEPEEEEPPVVEDVVEEEDLGDPGPAGDEVDIIIPALLAYGSNVDEMQEFVGPDMQVISKNPDGSFTIRMSEADQQDLIESTKQSVEELIMSIYTEDVYPGIVDIEWDTENFSEINILVNDDFFAEDSYSIFAVMALGYNAPMVQVYMGYGLDSITLITVTDSVTGEVYLEVLAPDGIMDLFE